MRFILVFGILACLLAAGCVSPPAGEAPQQQVPEKNKTCRMVSDEVPVTKEECGDVSFTEEVCSLRKLNYSATTLPRVDLCIGDGGCTGKPLGDCAGCSKAMTRCVMRISSLEAQKSGTWVVGANYTLGNSGFEKDPISKTIGPNETADFDFNQIYTPGYPTNSASCTLAVVSEPTVEACVGHTKVETECKNVTRTESRERQVCE